MNVLSVLVPIIGVAVSFWVAKLAVKHRTEDRFKSKLDKDEFKDFKIEINKSLEKKADSENTKTEFKMITEAIKTTQSHLNLHERQNEKTFDKIEKRMEDGFKGIADLVNVVISKLK